MLIVALSKFVYAQPTFNIPFDTLYQTCPPDSVFLYLFADSLNSNNFTYDTIPYQTEPVGGTSVAMWDDQVLGPFSIGFNYTFFCNTYTQFYIGSNGWIGFTAGQTTSWVVQTIPSTATTRPHDCIMGPWRDWNPGVGTGPYITYQTVGTAPLRKLIVTWSAVPMYSCTSTYGTFQIVLHEASNIIHNNMTNVPVCLGWGNGDGTQGVHNLPGTIGVAVAGRNDSQFTVTNQSIRFIPTSPINWSTINGNPINIGNGVYFSAIQPTWIEATGVTCAGDTLKDSVYVNVNCLYLDMNSLDVDCTGDSTGYLVAIDTAIATNAPYTYYWLDASGDTIAIHNSNDSIDTLYNVPAGNYTVIAITGGGQFALGFTSVNEPDTIATTATTIDVDCTGEPTGQALVQDPNNYSGLNWDGLYSYYWEDGSGTIFSSTLGSAMNSNSVGNLAAGTYNVTVDGCYVQTATFTIDEPDTINATTSEIPVLCKDGNTGMAIAIDQNNYSGLNWNGVYSYYWASGATLLDSTINVTNNTDTLTMLTAGTYNVTVDGCFIQTGSVTVTEPTYVVASIINATKTSCPGESWCDASADGSGAGGIPPYTYMWSTGESTQTANMLCPGTNWVTVTDANGCDSSTSVDILVPDSIVTSAFGDTMICITNPAAISASSIGGTPPFTYVWTLNALNGPVASTLNADAVYPHVTSRYFVSSTDGNGCPGDTASVLILVRPPLGLELPHVDTICPYDTIDIEVAGIGGDSIYTYTWSTGAFGPTLAVSPDLPVWYYLTVSDFCGTPTYSDSVFVQVGGYSAINASIRVEDDSLCAGESIYLIASGRGGFKGPDEYRYAWDKSSFDGDPVQFVRPLQTTQYIVTITDLCLSPAGADTVTVYVGQPEVPDFTATPAVSCSDAMVTISIDSVKENYRYDWNLGDGDKVYNAQTEDINHYYKHPGCYDVTLTVVTDFGCVGERREPCLISIRQSPAADFSNSPLNPTTLEPFVQFTDRSENAAFIQWQLNGTDWSTDSLFRYEFMDTGYFEVDLIAYSSDGCADTASRTLHHTVATTIHIPGSFSPNNDRLNDVFLVVGEGLSAKGFDMQIFDRWGRRLFHSTDPAIGWDGKMGGDHEYVPAGSYAYIVQYIDRYGESRKLTGQVIVSKTGERTGGIK